MFHLAPLTPRSALSFCFFLSSLLFLSLHQVQRRWKGGKTSGVDDAGSRSSQSARLGGLLLSAALNLAGVVSDPVTAKGDEKTSTHKGRRLEKVVLKMSPPKPNSGQPQLYVSSLLATSSYAAKSHPAHPRTRSFCSETSTLESAPTTPPGKG